MQSGIRFTISSLLLFQTSANDIVILILTNKTSLQLKISHKFDYLSVNVKLNEIIWAPHFFVLILYLLQPHFEWLRSQWARRHFWGICAACSVGYNCF